MKDDGSFEFRSGDREINRFKRQEVKVKRQIWWIWHGGKNGINSLGYSIFEPCETRLMGLPFTEIAEERRWWGCEKTIMGPECVLNVWSWRYLGGM